MVRKSVEGRERWWDLERLLDEAIEWQSKREADEVSAELGGDGSMKVIAWLLVLAFWVAIFVVAYLF